MSSKIRITIISANKSGVPQDIQALETKISNYLPGTRGDEIESKPERDEGGFGILIGALIYIGNKLFEKTVDHVLDWLGKTITKSGGKTSIQIELEDEHGK